MIKNDYIIRLEKAEDYNKTENLVRKSFWNVYREGCVEHYVLKCLRNDADFVPQLDFVMEHNGEIIGQIIFVKADIAKDDGSVLPVLTFGPVCIHPAYQGRAWAEYWWTTALKKRQQWALGRCLSKGISTFTATAD